MNFAFLGLDADADALLQGVIVHPDHQVVWIGIDDDAAMPPRLDSEQPASLPDPTRLSRTAPLLEASLLESGAEAVVVAYQEDASLLLDRVRRIHGLRIPLVLMHPVNLSVLTHYELELIASDRSARILPYRSAAHYLAARALVGSSDASDQATALRGAFGTIEHVTCERTLRDASAASILRAFASDIALMQSVVGDVTEVAAMSRAGIGKIDLPVDVQMSGATGVLVRWSATSTADDEKATLTVTGSDGAATLRMPSEGPWSFHCGPGHATTTLGEELSPSEYARVDALVAQVGHRAGEADRAAQWRPVSRSLELAEGFEKSIRKGRTIHLRYEGRGETDAFKGTMASVGCGLLIAGFFLFVVVAVAMKFAKVEGLTRLNTVLTYLPHAILGLLVAFLLLQVLRFIIPHDR